MYFQHVNNEKSTTRLIQDWPHGGRVQHAQCYWWLTLLRMCLLSGVKASLCLSPCEKQEVDNQAIPRSATERECSLHNNPSAWWFWAVQCYWQSSFVNNLCITCCPWQKVIRACTHEQNLNKLYDVTVRVNVDKTGMSLLTNLLRSRKSVLGLYRYQYSCYFCFVFLCVCVIRPAQLVFFNVLSINPPGEVSRFPT